MFRDIKFYSACFSNAIRWLAACLVWQWMGRVGAAPAGQPPTGGLATDTPITPTETNRPRRPIRQRSRRRQRTLTTITLTPTNTLTSTITDTPTHHPPLSTITPTLTIRPLRRITLSSANSAHSARMERMTNLSNSTTPPARRSISVDG